MTTSWSIPNMKRQADTGLVTEVDFIVNYEKNGHTVRRTGRVMLTGDTNDASFVPYADLNEATVVGWVQAELGNTAINALAASASNEIDDLVQEIASKNEAAGTAWL